MRRIAASAAAALAVVALVAATPRSTAGVDPFVRILALESQRSLGEGALAEYLASSDVRIAARAALAIGRTRLKAGAPLLIARADDARVPVRALSIYGLGLIAVPQAAAPVLAALGDGNGAVRIAALDAAGRLEIARAFDASGERAAAAGIARLSRTDADPLVRARAATELGAFSTGPASFAASLALVRAVRDDASESVRWHAMWTIFRGYATRVPRELLTAALHDRDELVRLEAVRAYGRLKDPGAVAALRPLLDDPSWRVQEQANESILVLEGKPPTDHLAALLPGLHLPPVAADPLASIPALPRAGPAGKPVAPTVGAATLGPPLLPRTAAEMLGPAPGPHPRVRIVTTKGDLYLTLYPEWAPLTVENFLNVADAGYFDGNRWFRIVPDFVVQTGDPTDNGDGDAGYSIGAEENPLEQDAFIISMGMNYTDPPDAHAIRDSAGTQFYITLSPQLHLDKDFTVFGALTSGRDVLARLVESDRMIRVDRLPDVVL